MSVTSAYVSHTVASYTGYNSVNCFFSQCSGRNVGKLASVNAAPAWSMYKMCKVTFVVMEMILEKLFEILN